MTLLPSSCRPQGVILASLAPALGAACLLAGVLAFQTHAAASEPEAKRRGKVDCHSLPAGTPPPAECRKSANDSDGDRLPDASDRCPAAAEDSDGFEDDDGCPDPDNDGDGALDEEDGCPLEPEDRDGFKDADGCPEPDNDGDGVLDTRDVCPLDAESFDGSGDGDGCPDLLMVSQRLEPAAAPPTSRHATERAPTLPPKPATSAGDGHAAAAEASKSATAMHEAPRAAAKSNTEPMAPKPCPSGSSATPEGGCLGAVDSELYKIADTVQFARRTENLLESSHSVLDRVVDLLDTNRNLRVMIVGHADGRGNDQFNLRLSMLRAMAVRAYLIQQSRDADDLSHRLDAVGIGARQPVGSNASAVGRSRNRRVEFIVVDRNHRSVRRPPPPAASAPARHAPAAPAPHAPAAPAPHAPAAHAPAAAHH